MTDVVLSVDGLAKTFYRPVLETDWVGFGRLALRGSFRAAGALVNQRVDAVRGVSFEVARGKSSASSAPTAPARRRPSRC